MYTVVSTNSIQHSWAGSDKSYSPEEKAKEKQYNHEYYIKNKEKWGVKSGSSTSTKAEYKEYTEGDSDFDDDKYSDENMIPDSDFYTFKNKDGRTVIIEEDMKWTLPAGVEVDDKMKKQLAEFEGFNDPSIKTRDDWFDAVNAIINKEEKKMVSEKEHEATSGGKLKSILDKKSTIKHSWAGSDKNYTAEEKAKEKKYNHEYYMKNKEKWGVGLQRYKKGESEKDSDFDESNLTENNRIGDTDFFAFKNKDGKWVVTIEDKKWVLPEGVEVDADMRKQLSEFKGMDGKNIKTSEDWEEAVNSIINKGKKTSDGTPEFDVDAAAMDVIRGKYKNGQERKDELGEDYEAVQKRVNELMKEMGKTSSTKKEEEKKSDTSKDLKDRGFSSSTDGMKKDDKKKSTVKHSYTVVTSDDELYHHGILGQRWGVRRYQNADGSLTSEGRRHYGSKSKSTVENPPAVGKTKSSSNLSSDDLNKILNESGKLTNSTSNASKSISKLKKSKDAKKNKQNENENKEPEKKLEDMSDQELREFLNRYDMEQRYEKIQKEKNQDIMDGKQTAQEILNVTKDVVAIASSAALIYNILKRK